MIGMEGFGLLLGHLAGDYVVQNDWMARWKTGIPGSLDPVKDGPKTFAVCHRWYREWRPVMACTVHCLLYTLAVFLMSFTWMPWWGLAACFLAHWPVDRWRLAAWWMRNVSGQSYFASDKHPLYPWPVVVVDNTFHLLTLFVIGVLA
jgi:hypothetical protein